MYLLAVDPPVLAAPNSTYILVGAVIAGLVALIVALVTNWRADVREVEKTRREVLTTAAASLIQKSDLRYQAIEENAYINGWDEVNHSQHRRWSKWEQNMKFDLAKIQIHASQLLYQSAQTLYELHSDSESNLMDLMLDQTTSPNYEIDYQAITAARATLIQTVRKEAKLNKRIIGSNLTANLRIRKRST